MCIKIEGILKQIENKSFLKENFSNKNFNLWKIYRTNRFMRPEVKFRQLINKEINKNERKCDDCPRYDKK